MFTSKEKRIAALNDVDLYPVTSQEHSAGRTTLDIVDALAAAGCHMIQLREKTLSKRAYYELALEVRARTHGILLICNDHLDVALAVGADGVHLGTDDLPLVAARRLAPHLILGASTHNLDEALQAQAAGADYINIGPVFPTQTKEGHDHFLGIQGVAEIARHIQVPFTVMGGIKEEHIPDLVRVGARRIALVTAVTAAPSPLEAAHSLRNAIHKALENQESGHPSE